ncbi:MAG: SEC-C metal-binding domain-containing protein, partial [Gemmatimonadaceae bacterium]
EPPNRKAAVRPEPIVTGAGRVKSLNAIQNAGVQGDWSTTGRNDPCPCGSGKKFKKCHGATN